MGWLLGPNLACLTLLFVALTPAFMASSARSYDKYEIDAEQSVSAYQSGSTSMWKLEVDISASEIRCAKNVTATFTLDKTLSPAEVRAVTGPAPVSHWWSRNRNGITLWAQWRPEETACIEPYDAKLVVDLYCAKCQSIYGDVLFFLNNIQTQRLIISREGTHSTAWRLSARVDRGDLRRTVGGTAFTAVFTFPSLEGRTIESFAARPRTLLAEPESWFTRSIQGASLVYAAMRLPDPLSENSCFPEVAIDVECQACDIKRASVAYLPARPEWDEVSGEATLMEFSENEGERVPLIEKSVVKSESACEMTFETTAYNLWKNNYKGLVHITMDQPMKTAPEFSWKVNGLQHQARRITSGVHHFVEIATDDQHFPVDLGDPTVTLRMRLEQCDNYRSAETYLPYRPATPRGASEVDRGVLYGFCDKSTCEIRSEGGSVKRASIFRLWLSSTKQLPSTVKEAIISGFNQIMRTWEKELNENELNRNIGPNKYNDLIRGDYFRLVDAEYDYGEYPSSNVDSTEDLSLQIKPSPYQYYGAAQWSIETILSQATAENLCNRNVALQYTITGLPKSLRNLKVFVTGQWVARESVRKQIIYIRIFRKGTNRGTVVNSLRFYVDCGGPCDKPNVEVSLKHFTPPSSRAIPLFA